MRSVAILTLLLAMAVVPSGPESPFYGDDPLSIEPETQDASGATARDVSLEWDILYNLFARRGRPEPTRALDVNTVNEVPDSSWFINRAGAAALTPADVERGPAGGRGPAPGPWTITSGKTDGVMPGFVARDAAGVRWFIKLDPPDWPELASGAEVVSTKLLWALGYHVPDNRIAVIHPADLRIDANATFKEPNGRKRPLRMGDMKRLLSQGARRLDGHYRVLASRALQGKPLGPFLYFGTRTDDPNDIIPHEHRRSLRGLRVFAAWLNHVDAKAINTLDTVVTEGNRTVIRHHLLDFGSTLGSAGTGPRDYYEGHEHLYESGATLKAALSAGFLLPIWRRISYESPRAIGRFEANAFDPRAWKPRTPNVAFLHATADDEFWATRKLASLDRSLIAAAVRSARYSDPEAERYLIDTLVRRRRRILDAYLPAITPVVDPSLSTDGTLRFSNLALDLDVARRPEGYSVVWYVFDNGSGTSTPLGHARGSEPVFAAPVSLPAEVGTFVRVDISIVDARVPRWTHPVRTFFRRESSTWRLVGLQRSDEAFARRAAN